MTGELFIVATPIGNLADLSVRQIETLKRVDVIAAEDTRHAGKLLNHVGVDARVVACHDHNERDSTEGLLKLLADGKSVALISDAGTPLISDPGFHLVSECHSRGFHVVPIPGPSAVTAALSVAGIPTARFTFEGFLPSKSNARQARLQALSGETRTMVFFEAPHRIGVCLADIAREFGESRSMTVCRELSKKFEQVVSGTVTELTVSFNEDQIPERGEFVLVVAGAEDAGQRLDIDQLLGALLKELPPAKAASVAAKVTGETRATLYDRALQLR